MGTDTILRQDERGNSHENRLVSKLNGKLSYQWEDLIECVIFFGKKNEYMKWKFNSKYKDFDGTQFVFYFKLLCIHLVLFYRLIVIFYVTSLQLTEGYIWNPCNTEEPCSRSKK